MSAAKSTLSDNIRHSILPHKSYHQQAVHVLSDNIHHSMATPLGLVRSPISAPPRTQKAAPYLDSAHRSALICSMQADKHS